MNPMTMDDAGSLASPHFDEEATLLAARPVVPLEQVAIAPSSRQRKSFLLPMVIIAAALAGAAGALAVDYFRNHQHAAAIAPTVTQPAPVAPAVETSKAATHPASPTAITIPAPSDKTSDAATNNTESANSSSNEADAKRTERDAAIRASREAEVKTKDESRAKEAAKAKAEKVSPPIVERTRVERGNDTTVMDWRDLKEQRREARREERRRQREADREGDNAAPQVERGGRELNRIRDIFEGPRRP